MKLLKNNVVGGFGGSVVALLYLSAEAPGGSVEASKNSIPETFDTFINMYGKDALKSFAKANKRNRALKDVVRRGNQVDYGKLYKALRKNESLAQSFLSQQQEQQEVSNDVHAATEALREEVDETRKKGRQEAVKEVLTKTDFPENHQDLFQRFSEEEVKTFIEEKVPGHFNGFESHIQQKAFRLFQGSNNLWLQFLKSVGIEESIGSQGEDKKPEREEPQPTEEDMDLVGKEFPSNRQEFEKKFPQAFVEQFSHTIHLENQNYPSNFNKGGASNAVRAVFSLLQADSIVTKARFIREYESYVVKKEYLENNPDKADKIIDTAVEGISDSPTPKQIKGMTQKINLAKEQFEGIYHKKEGIAAALQDYIQGDLIEGGLFGWGKDGLLKLTGNNDDLIRVFEDRGFTADQAEEIRSYMKDVEEKANAYVQESGLDFNRYAGRIQDPEVTEKSKQQWWKDVLLIVTANIPLGHINTPFGRHSVAVPGVDRLHQTVSGVDRDVFSYVDQQRYALYNGKNMLTKLSKMKAQELTEQQTAALEELKEAYNALEDTRADVYRDKQNRARKDAFTWLERNFGSNSARYEMVSPTGKPRGQKRYTPGSVHLFEGAKITHTETTNQVRVNGQTYDLATYNSDGAEIPLRKESGNRRAGRGSLVGYIKPTGPNTYTIVPVGKDWANDTLRSHKKILKKEDVTYKEAKNIVEETYSILHAELGHDYGVTIKYTGNENAAGTWELEWEGQTLDLESRNPNGNTAQFLKEVLGHKDPEEFSKNTEKFIGRVHQVYELQRMGVFLKQTALQEGSLNGEILLHDNPAIKHMMDACCDPTLLNMPREAVVALKHRIPLFIPLSILSGGSSGGGGTETGGGKNGNLGSNPVHR